MTIDNSFHNNIQIQQNYQQSVYELQRQRQLQQQQLLIQQQQRQQQLLMQQKQQQIQMEKYLKSCERPKVSSFCDENPTILHCSHVINHENTDENELENFDQQVSKQTRKHNLKDEEFNPDEIAQVMNKNITTTLQLSVANSLSLSSQSREDTPDLQTFSPRSGNWNCLEILEDLKDNNSCRSQSEFTFTDFEVSDYEVDEDDEEDDNTHENISLDVLSNIFNDSKKQNTDINKNKSSNNISNINNTIVVKQNQSNIFNNQQIQQQQQLQQLQMQYQQLYFQQQQQQQHQQLLLLNQYYNNIKQQSNNNNNNNNNYYYQQRCNKVSQFSYQQ